VNIPPKRRVLSLGRHCCEQDKKEQQHREKKKPAHRAGEGSATSNGDRMGKDAGNQWLGKEAEKPWASCGTYQSQVRSLKSEEAWLQRSHVKGVSTTY
jgi:hypothetical protein